MGRQLVVPAALLRPYFLAEHPHVSGQYFCGNHIGLYSSTDMVSWEDVGGGVLPDSVRCIWFSPTDPFDIMVGTERGVYRSNPADPGWVPVAGIPALPVYDIETGWHQMGPYDPAIFVSIGNGSFNDGVLCSHDMGHTWERILTIPEPTDLLQDYTEQHHPLVMFVGTRGHGIVRVDCCGELLGDLNAGLPNLTVHCMRYDPFIDTPAIYAGTEEGLHLCMLLEQSAVGGEVADRPAERHTLVLSRAWPNPWSSDVAFRLAGGLPDGPVTLRVFDPAGRQVWSAHSSQPTGGGVTFSWSGRDRGGRNVPDGIYFYRFELPGQTLDGKIIRLE